MGRDGEGMYVRTLATAMERATGPMPSRMVDKRPIFIPSTVL